MHREARFGSYSAAGVDSCVYTYGRQNSETTTFQYDIFSIKQRNVALCRFTNLDMHGAPFIFNLHHISSSCRLLDAGHLMICYTFQGSSAPYTVISFPKNLSYTLPASFRSVTVVSVIIERLLYSFLHKFVLSLHTFQGPAFHVQGIFPLIYDASKALNCFCQKLSKLLFL